MKIVIVSDTHMLDGRLSPLKGDLLIHCGDFYEGGTRDKWLKRLNLWFERQTFGMKIYVPGNHDFPLADWGSSAERALYSAELLVDRTVEFEGLKIFGSPWAPGLEGWAYGVPTGRRDAWAAIPDETDILATHMPPHRILDATADGVHVGCPDLRRKVFAVRPMLHCFGHAHDSSGTATLEDIRFVNASQAINGQIRNAPVLVDL